MWYFLDKRGRPIEWLKGRRLSNFIRFLLYCRNITTERPDCMFPCWMCWNCGYVEDYDSLPSLGIICPKCNKASVTHIEKRYRPLTPGATQSGSKKPPIKPKPDIKVPAQVAKPKEPARYDEEIKQLRAELDRIKEGYAKARNEISRRVTCTCISQGGEYAGPHLWTCPLGILYRTFDELMDPGSSTPGAELPKFRNKTGKEKR